jgi:hypothetical protein
LIQKYNQYKYEILSFFVPFLLLLFSYFIYTFIFDLNLIGNDDLYFQQQIALIEYIRDSFYMTHDLFPQLNMRHGGFSSFANLIYYGSMNPIIWLSFLFPMMSIQTFLELSLIFYISIISLLNYKIIKFETKNKNLSLLVGYAFAVAPVIICHLQYQLQYIWFYPFFLLAMWSIQKFEKRFVIYGLSFGMIFYFNFQLAFACFIFLLIYFLYLIWGKALNIYTAKDYIIYFLFISTIGLMIGFLPLIVQLATINPLDYIEFSGLINIHFIRDIFIESSETFGYSWQMYLYTVIAFLSIVFIQRTRIFVYMIFLVIATLIVPLNQMLNILMPYDLTIFIYFTPILMVVFAKTILLLREFNLSEKIKILSFANIFIIFLLLLNFEQTQWKLTIELLLIQNIVITTLFFDLKTIVYTTIGATVIFTSFLTYATLGTEVYITPDACVESNKLERDMSMDEYNTTNCQNSYVMSSSTVITNEYLKEYADNNLLNKNDNIGINNELIFMSPINYEVLSVNSEKSINVEPFVYGVENSNIYANDIATFTNLDMLTHVEVEGYDYTYPDQPDDVINDKETHNMSSGETIGYDVTEYCDSYFSVSFVADNQSDVYVNDQLLTYENAVILEDGTRVNHYVMACSTLNEITITATEDITLSEIKIEFYDLNKLFNSEYPVNEPTNVYIDYNKGITFNLEMQTDGMLVTTIPYDNDFIIKVDGEKVDNQIVNHYFLGANVPAGNHKIEITYKMQGFTIGMIITLIGLFLISSLAYIVYFRKEKS